MASTLVSGLNYIAKEQLQKYLNEITSDENIKYPLIYTTPTFVNTTRVTPFIMPLVTNNVTPFIMPVGPNKAIYGYYPDLDKDSAVHKTVTKYFYYKIIDKWLYHDLRPLLAFIKIDDNKPQLIKSMSEYKPDELSKDSVENIEKKIQYMENILITKKLVKHVLKKIVNEHHIHWYHLNKNKDTIKKVFYKYIKSKLEEAIKNYNS